MISPNPRPFPLTVTVDVAPQEQTPGEAREMSTPAGIIRPVGVGGNRQPVALPVNSEACGATAAPFDSGMTTDEIDALWSEWERKRVADFFARAEKRRHT